MPAGSVKRTSVSKYEQLPPKPLLFVAAARQHQREDVCAAGAEAVGRGRVGAGVVAAVQQAVGVRGIRVDRAVRDAVVVAEQAVWIEDAVVRIGVVEVPVADLGTGAERVESRNPNEAGSVNTTSRVSRIVAGRVRGRHEHLEDDRRGSRPGVERSHRDSCCSRSPRDTNRRTRPVRSPATAASRPTLTSPAHAIDPSPTPIASRVKRRIALIVDPPPMRGYARWFSCAGPSFLPSVLAHPRAALL